MSLSIGGNIKNTFSLRKTPTYHPEVLESVLGVAQVLFALGRYGAPIKSYTTFGEDNQPNNPVKQSSITSMDLRSIDTRDASVMDNSSLGTCVFFFVVLLIYFVDTLYQSTLHCILISHLYPPPPNSLPFPSPPPHPFPSFPFRHGIPCTLGRHARPRGETQRDRGHPHLPPQRLFFQRGRTAGRQGLKRQGQKQSPAGDQKQQQSTIHRATYLPTYCTQTTLNQPSTISISFPSLPPSLHSIHPPPSPGRLWRAVWPLLHR